MRITTNHTTMRRAFSLVEVLLAILILALGLLGLGAVIPAVVKLQRRATDETLGTSVVNSAKAYLDRRPDFRESALTGVNAWDNMLGQTTWSPAGTNITNHLWQPWAQTGLNQLDLATGDMHFNGALTNPALRATIKIADRLWPGDASQPMPRTDSTRDPFRPQFVWDLVGRRVQASASAPPQVQVAVFVRRIDLNIRVPQGNSSAGQPFSLRDVLTGSNGLSTVDRRVPVAVDSNEQPTNTGTDPTNTLRYGNFLTLDAWFDADPDKKRDRIELSAGPLTSSGPTSDVLFALASQPGQKLVDNFGNVYTVLRTDDELEGPGTVTVVVSPPIPASVPDPQNTNTLATDRFRQVVFTPQIAAAVEVFTVTRPVK